MTLGTTRNDTATHLVLSVSVAKAVQDTHGIIGGYLRLQNRLLAPKQL